MLKYEHLLKYMFNYYSFTHSFYVHYCNISCVDWKIVNIIS
jgi:hypothetical protein